MKNFKKIFKCIFNLLKYLLLLAVCISIMSLLINNKQLSYIFSYIMFLLIYYIKNFTYIKDEFNNIKKLKKESIYKSLIICFTSTIICLITNYVLYKLLNTYSYSDILDKEMVKETPLLGFISACILAPFTEELIFRYSFKDYNNIISLIITTIIFALFHINFSLSTDYYFIIPYLFLSFSFSFMYYKNNNIFTSILYHIFNNLLIFVLLFI